MDYPPDHQRRTLLAPSGRLVFAPAPEKRPYGDRKALNEGWACDVPGCGASRFKMSRHCREHARNHAATGHPKVSSSVRINVWAPYYLQAEAFVREQLRLEHKGIEAAVRWAAEELFSQPVGPRVYRPGGQRSPIVRSDPRRPHRIYQGALGRARGNGVEPADLVARFIAAYLADDRGLHSRPTFRDDVHFQHQAARILLWGSPIGPSGWARRKRDPDTDPVGVARLRWRVRQYAFHRANAALGLLADRSAAEIRRRLEMTIAPRADTQRPVDGATAPFNSFTTDNQPRN